MPDLRRLGACTVTALLWTAVAGSLLISGVLYAEDSPAAPQPVNASAFAKLRSDYSSQPLYDAYYVGDEQRQALLEAIKAKDAQQVVALGQSWLKRCPVDGAQTRGLASDLFSESDIESWEKEIGREIDEAVAFAKSSPFPAREKIFEGIYPS